MSFWTVVGLIYTACTAWAVSVGIRRYRLLGRGGRALLQWLAVSLVIGLVMMSISFARKWTNPFAQLTYPLFGLLGIRALAALDGRKVAMRVGMAAWACYLTWWGWWLSQGEFRAAFGTYNAPALWFILSLAGMLVVIRRLAIDVDRPWEDSAVLAGWGMVLSFAPGVALEVLGSLGYDSDPDVVRLLFRLRPVVQIGGMVLFALSLQRNRT